MSHGLAAQARTKTLVPPSAPEYEVRVVEPVWVTMQDGVRLAGHLFMPVGQKPDEKFPVLFHYTPYRETAGRRYGRSAYLTCRGYVDAHFQIRGTGDSEGVLPEREYSEQEVRDALELIDWLSRQLWSTGKVGMYGFSWSGFNTAQVAMRRPPALRAIWVGVGTEDLYHENIQYLDGILHFGGYNFGIDVQMAQSPAPDFPLTEEYFRNRFDQPPWSLIFLRHQRDGAFWRRAQRLDVNPDALAIPTFAIGGWFDTYRSSIPRMLERMKAPVKAIVGPWNHSVGRRAERGALEPGPHVEWRHEKIRWWDYWLKGRDTGIMDEPKVTVYMRYSHEPEPWIRGKDIPGEWRSDSWPPQGLVQRPYFLHPDQQLKESAPTALAEHQLRYVPTTGPQAGQYWSNTQPDQRPVDAFSLVYESAPLTQELAILGRPRAILQASATAPLAHWFVRLSDVAPDGITTLITGAGLNGAHRNSSTDPEPMEPGKVYPLEVHLHFTSWVFKPGHRIRVAISNALWPMQWPSPYPMTTSLYLGQAAGATGQVGPGGSASAPRASHVLLPVVPLKSDTPLPAFASMPREPEEVMPGTTRPPPPRRAPFTRRPQQIVRDEITATMTVSFEDGEPGNMTKVTWRLSDERPDLAWLRGEHIITYKLPERELVWEGFTHISSDSTSFYYEHRRWVRENGRVVRERAWQDTIPRFYR